MSINKHQIYTLMDQMQQNMQQNKHKTEAANSGKNLQLWHQLLEMAVVLSLYVMSIQG